MKVTLKNGGKTTAVFLPGEREDMEKAIQTLGSRHGISITRCEVKLNRSKLLFRPLPDENSIERMDELNYLAGLLFNLEWEEDKEKLEAVLETEHAGYYRGDPLSVGELIHIVQNLGCYELNPHVYSVEELGYDFLFESGACAIEGRNSLLLNCAEIGEKIAAMEEGRFSLNGYVLRTGKPTKQYDGRLVPSKYRILPPELRELVEKVSAANEWVHSRASAV